MPVTPAGARGCIAARKAAGARGRTPAANKEITPRVDVRAGCHKCPKDGTE